MKLPQCLKELFQSRQELNISTEVVLKFFLAGSTRSKKSIGDVFNETSKRSSRCKPTVQHRANLGQGQRARAVLAQSRAYRAEL